MDERDVQCLTGEAADEKVLIENACETYFASEEVDVEIIPANDVYPFQDEAVIAVVSNKMDAEIIPVNDTYPLLEDVANSVPSSCMDKEEIEIPRGALRVLTNDFCLPPCNDVVLTETVEEEDDDSRKTRIFIESIKKDGVWARSLSEVKLSIPYNSYLTEDVVSDLLAHCITNVNNRPRLFTIASKSATLDDVANLIKLAFSVKDEDMALNNSLLRLYCKKPTNRLKDLAKILTTTCSSLEDVRISSGHIYAELNSTNSVIRYRTIDITKYLKLEHCIQDMKMRVQTSFNIRKRDDRSREVVISWFDEYKEGYGRVAFIHFDHIANCQTKNRVTFAEEATCQEFTVNTNATMMSVANLNHPVHDLIHFLSKIDSSQIKL